MQDLPPAAPKRRGFTLVEMMVAIVIFAILATIAIGAFSEGGNDKVPAAARQIRSMLFGAQSRAAKDQKARGLRLIVDPNLVDAGGRGGFVTSLAYVGVDEVTGSTAIPTTSTPPLTSVSWGWNLVEILPAMTASVWSDLATDGVDDQGNTSALQVGRRIYLRRSTDSPSEEVPFVISQVLSEDVSGDNDGYLDMGEDTVTMNSKIDVIGLRITGPLPPPVAPGVTMIYRMELAPQLLPNNDPVSLPQGTAIDLFASLQSSFQPSGSPQQFGDVDLMFSPRGGVDQGRVLDSVVHLYVGDVEDSFNSRPTGTLPRPYYVSQAVRPQRIVSVFCNTGQIKTSEYGPDNTMTANQYEQFIFAVGGKEAK